MSNQITVLLSSYNGEKYIRQQIESILNQEGCEVKLIVRDDGSSDATLEILHQYEKEGLLSYQSDKNIGPAKSFMTMIRNAPDSEYYALADQDDIWLPDKLKTGISYLANHHGPAVYCSNLLAVDDNLNEKGNLLPENVRTDFRAVACDPGYFFGCTMVFNSEMKNLIASKPVPDHMIMHDLWIALIASYCGNLIYDSNPHIRYRIHTGNYTVQGRNEKFHRLKETLRMRDVTIAEQLNEFRNYIGTENAGNAVIMNIIADYQKSAACRMKVISWVIRQNDLKLLRRLKTAVRIYLKKY